MFLSLLFVTPVSASRTSASSSATVTLTVNKTTVGTYLRDLATITGAPQLVTLSYTSTNPGLTMTFETTTITDSLSGVLVKTVIHESSTLATGTYYLTVTATGADGAKSSVTITVSVITMSLTLSSSSVTISPSNQGVDTAAITGSPQSVSLSRGTCKKACVCDERCILYTFASSPITDSLAGVTDVMTITVGSLASAGTYQETVTATGVDGQTASVVLNVIVTG